MLPLISIVVVTFRAGATLEACLKSVISQRYKNIELVVIDGGSDDNTLDIIQAHTSHIGYWVSEKDKGIYDAMNKGIKACKGDWVIFLGADDIFFSDTILTEIFMENEISVDVSFLYGNIILKSNGELRGGSRDYYQLIDNNIPHQAIFYKKKLLEQLGGYNCKYKILADYDINLRIFRDPGIIKKYLPVTVSLFNDKGTSNTTIDTDFFQEQLHYFITKDKLKANSPLLQKYYFFNGFAYILQQQWLKGIRGLWQALRTGERKFYYFLVTGLYFLSIIGFRKKIKSS